MPPPSLLYTEDWVQVFRGTPHGRQAIEKAYAKYDFQRCRFNNRLITVDRLNGVGNDVRAIGRWSDGVIWGSGVLGTLERNAELWIMQRIFW
jgi:hypothetical protein